MPEKNLIVNTQSVSFEGIFEPKELLKTISGWCLERSYVPIELMDQEVVHEDARFITVIYEPFKKYTDYIRYMLDVSVAMSNVKEIIVERMGARKKMYTGQVTVDMRAFLHTDYDGRWESRPIYYFFRTIVDKYIYPVYTGRFEADVTRDFYELKGRIQTVLNVNKY